MPNYGAAIQTNKIPIQGLVPQKSATPPANPVTGELWTDTSVTPNVVKQWNGTSWIRTDGGDLPDGTVTNAKVAANANIALTKLATDPLARANHTGTQPASTISDFNTAVRTNRLDQMAAPSVAVDFNGQRATNAAAPAAAGDLVNRQYLENYIDTRITSQDWKNSVRAATTGNVTLSGLQTIDGVELDNADRVLVKAQTNPAQNGIYVVGAGAWSRTTDANDSSKVTTGMTVPVEEGTANGGTIWLLASPNPISLGTTELEFVQIGGSGATYTAGTGLTLTGNEFALDTPVPVALGGTGAATADTARAALKAPGVYTALMPALTPGVPVNIVHGLGTKNILEPSFRKTDTEERVILYTESVNDTTVAVRSDIAFAAGDLQITVVG